MAITGHKSVASLTLYQSNLFLTPTFDFNNCNNRASLLTSSIEVHFFCNYRICLKFKRFWIIDSYYWFPGNIVKVLAHVLVHVTDFPVVNVHVDELSSARIWQHKLCATYSANVNINNRLPIKEYYRICTLRHGDISSVIENCKSSTRYRTDIIDGNIIKKLFRF
jgi:hypothetical protein